MPTLSAGILAYFSTFKLIADWRYGVWANPFIHIADTTFGHFVLTVYKAFRRTEEKNRIVNWLPAFDA